MLKGSIVHRVIRGKDRYYHQWREGGQTHSRYLKADEVLPLRQALEAQRGTVPAHRAQRGTVPAHRGTVPVDAAACRVSKGGNHLLSDATGCRVYNNSPRGTVPIHQGTDPIGEMAYGVRKFGKRACVDDVLAFIRDEDDSRILILHGLPGSGKTTIIRQALGQLTPDERAEISLRTLPFTPDPARQLVPIDTTALSFRDFAVLEKTSDILAFIERGGSPSAPFRDTDAARAFVDSIAGPESWATLEGLTIPFLCAALLARTPQGQHGRTREAIDRQKLIAALDALQALRSPDAARVSQLVDLGLLVWTPVEVLRPNFTRTRVPLFTQPGLRFCVARHLLVNCLESAPLAMLGAAERKMLRDRALNDIREQVLEDAVLLETHRRLASDDIAVVRVEAGANRLGMVIADRNELTCELYETRLADDRDVRHLVHLTDYRFLDALEHRYGTVTDRFVLYNGRDARHPSGVSYRNVGAFLARP